MIKKRLDILLYEKGLVSTRAQATMLIKKSGVRCEGVLCYKPGIKVDENSSLELVEKEIYVSRGAYKLKKALEYWDLSAYGKICADIGASTGGFTQILLEGGAKKVYAIDVGHGQLAESLREDPRVINLEKLNARYDFSLGEPVDMIVSDLSHISILKVLPQVLKILKLGGLGVILIKPQFEAGVSRIGKGGIVSEVYHSQILEEVQTGLESLGAKSRGIIESPIQGKSGNKEYLAYFFKAS